MNSLSTASSYISGIVSSKGPGFQTRPGVYFLQCSNTPTYNQNWHLFRRNTILSLGYMLFVYVLLELLAGEVMDTGGVTFVSAFQGLFAPYWNAEARGYVCL